MSVVVLEEMLCEWVTFSPSAPRLWPLLLPDPNSDPECSGILQNPGYLGNHVSLEETPSECSGSDCSSSSCDSASLELSTNLFSTVPQPSFPEDVSLFDWEDIVTEAIETGNALGLDFAPKTFSLEDQAVATSTPQAESLRAPPHHQDARGFGCTYQEHQAFHGNQHLAPPSDSRADETLAGEGPQDIRLGTDVSDAAGPEQIQGLCTFSCERADAYPQSREPHRDDLEDWPRLSMYGKNSHPNECECECWRITTPPLRPISWLGEEQGDNQLLYSGPNLGGWLSGNLGGVPKTTALSSLEVDLPEPFSIEN